MIETIGPSCKKLIIGIRPIEKIHEEMITISGSFTTNDLVDIFYYAKGMTVCKSSTSQLASAASPLEHIAYNSEFLILDKLSALIREHLVLAFQPNYNES